MKVEDLFKNDAQFKRVVAALMAGDLRPHDAAARLVEIGWTAEQAWAYVGLIQETVTKTRGVQP